MSSFRRSLITWSPGFTSGDYDTNLVTAGLDMLEIGARQLNDWRLHELPDFLPFCQPSVPLNMPILSIAATSSLPTTWSVQVSTHAPQPLVSRPGSVSNFLSYHACGSPLGVGTSRVRLPPTGTRTIHSPPPSSLKPSFLTIGIKSLVLESYSS